MGPAAGRRKPAVLEALKKSLRHWARAGEL